MLPPRARALNIREVTRSSPVATTRARGGGRLEGRGGGCLGATIDLATPLGRAARERALDDLARATRPLAYRQRGPLGATRRLEPFAPEGHDGRSPRRDLGLETGPEAPATERVRRALDGGRTL